MTYTLHTIEQGSLVCIYCGTRISNEDLKAISQGLYGVSPEGVIAWPGLVEGEYRDCREVKEGQLKLELC